MKTNINKSDRIIRIFIALFLIVVSQRNVTNDPLLDLILLIVGCYFLLTVLINYCIIYAFLDFSSVKQKKSRKKYKRF